MNVPSKRTITKLTCIPKILQLKIFWNAQKGNKNDPFPIIWKLSIKFKVKYKQHIFWAIAFFTIVFNNFSLWFCCYIYSTRLLPMSMCSFASLHALSPSCPYYSNNKLVSGKVFWLLRIVCSIQVSHDLRNHCSYWWYPAPHTECCWVADPHWIKNSLHKAITLSMFSVFNYDMTFLYQKYINELPSQMWYGVEGWGARFFNVERYKYVDCLRK